MADDHNPIARGVQDRRGPIPAFEPGPFARAHAALAESARRAFGSAPPSKAGEADTPRLRRVFTDDGAHVGYVCACGKLWRRQTNAAEACCSHLDDEDSE